MSAVRSIAIHGGPADPRNTQGIGSGQTEIIAPCASSAAESETGTHLTKEDVTASC